MSPNHIRTTLTAAILLAVVVAGGVVHADVATQEGPPQPSDEQRPPSDDANFTVYPNDGESRQPGASGASYTMLSRGEGPWGDSQGLERIESYKITSQQAVFDSCSPQNARAFGIDRNNDNSGTTTDEALLQHMESYSISGRTIAVQIYGEDSFAGEPTYLNRSDETVAVLADCVENTGEAGWYQFTGYVNGTNYQGNYQEVTLYSKYFAICDCENRQEAEQQLGPPPHSEGSGDGGDATPTDGDGGDGATPTPTEGDGGDGGDATPTPTDGGDGGDGATPTPTDTGGNGGDGGDGGATPTPTDGGDGATPTDGNVTTTTGGDGGDGGADPTTPTVSDGQPGFGPLVAILALLGAALLALRRRE